MSRFWQKHVHWPLNWLTINALAFLWLVLLASVSTAMYTAKQGSPSHFPVDAELDFVNCGPRLVSMAVGSRYFYNRSYGWFDPSHFATGNPTKIIRDVRGVAANGGGVVTIRQEVRGGITGYTGHYRVSRRVTSDQAIGVALGIYLDWSRRFEAWEDHLPHGLFGPFTSFAVEDLPSQYIGFFAAVHDLDPVEVLACHLGGAHPAEATPPRLVPAADVPGAIDSFPGLRHLVNKTFIPFVPTADGWRHIPWPDTLHMTAVGKTTGLWRFESEETWYFDEALVLAAD